MKGKFVWRGRAKTEDFFLFFPLLLSKEKKNFDNFKEGKLLFELHDNPRKPIVVAKTKMGALNREFEIGSSC